MEHDPTRESNVDKVSALPDLDSKNVTDRIRKSTPKGLQYKLLTVQKLMDRLYKRLRSEIVILQNLILSNNADNIDLVNGEATNLDRIYTELCDAYARAGVVIADDEVGGDSEMCVSLTILMDEAESKYLAAKGDICTWLLNPIRVGCKESPFWVSVHKIYPEQEL